MAIAATNGMTEYLKVLDGVVTARVTYELKDGDTFITGHVKNIAISNATDAEIAAAISLADKAAALAVA
jgi:hypothetical protein